MGKICVIDGPIGAGKSTLLALLKKKYKCFEEPIKDWGNLLQEFYGDMDKFAYPFQLQVLLSQKKQYDVMKKEKNTVFVERSPYTSRYVFFEMLKNQEFINNEETRVYDKHFNTISYEPDHYFILDLPVDIAYQRIKIRGRPEEENITKEYLTNLHNKFLEVYTNKSNVTFVDATKNPYEILSEILLKNF